MKAEIFWLDGPWPGRLAIAPRPRGGDWLEEEVQSWRKQGIKLVVSLLTDDEVAELDLGNEADFCRASGIRYTTFPIADRQTPQIGPALFEFLASITEQLLDGTNCVIHCRQGIGRAAVVAISLLVISGIDPIMAMKSVSDLRGCSVPETPEQRRWILEFAKMPVAPIPG